MRYRSLHGSGLGVPECTDFGALTDHLCRRWPPGRRGPIEGPEPLLRDTTRSSALARCQSGEDLLVDQSVGGHGVAAERAVLSLEGREAAARLRDDRDQREHVVQRELRFAGGSHRALGHQHVRPEVAIGAGAPEALHQDRKSTRLNSSHVAISYAVFCLKKKTKLRSPCPNKDAPEQSTCAPLAQS